MRVRPIALLTVISLLPLVQIGMAADVGFQLETNSLAAIDEPHISELTGVEIKDRVWAAPGIEDASRPPAFRNNTGWDGPLQKFRIETSVSAEKHSYLDVAPQMTIASPTQYSFADALWPFTRQMFAKEEECRMAIQLASDSGFVF